MQFLKKKKLKVSTQMAKSWYKWNKVCMEKGVDNQHTLC